MMDYDLLVIGAGTAGKNAAMVAVSLGARTAIIEEDGFASACLGNGCIQKKVPVSTVEQHWKIKRADEHGITGVEHIDLDWAYIVTRGDSL